MSKYTTEVRFICESYAGLDESGTYTDVNTIIEKSRDKIFDFNFPIFDEPYRSVLETKILKHFYTREIGLETVGLWKLKLDTKMNEVMPYYNEMYKTTLLEYNPLYNVDYNTVHNGQSIGNEHKTGQESETATGTETGKTTGTNNKNVTSVENEDRSGKGGTQATGESTNFNTSNDQKTDWRYFSNTPQGGIDNVENLSYLTDITKNTGSDNRTDNGNIKDSSTTNYADEGNTKRDKTDTEKGEHEENRTGSHENSVNRGSEDTTTFNNTEDYTQHVYGKTGGESYAKLIQDFRDSLINVDLMVFDELEELFLHLW